MKIATLMLFVVCLAGCASVQYPVPMPDGSIEFARYRYIAQNKQWYLEVHPDGSIIFKQQTNSEQMAKMIGAATAAAVRAAMSSATGGAGL